MISFLPLLQQMLVANIMGQRPSPRFSSVDVILRTMSFVLLLVGLFLSVYAEYIWLGIFLPFYLATLMTGVTLILLSALLTMLSRHLKIKRADPPHHQPPIDFVALLTEIINSLDEDLEGTIRENPKTAVLLSTLGGLMVGRKISP